MKEKLINKAVNDILKTCQKEMGISPESGKSINAEDLSETGFTEFIGKILESQKPKTTVAGTPVVVITHTFDAEVTVYEYDTDDDANDAVESLYKTYLEEELRNNSDLIESKCFLYKEEGWAQITWADETYTRFTQSYTQKEV